MSYTSCDFVYVYGGRPLLTLLYRKLHPLAFIQGAIPLPRDGGVVHKHVSARIAGDEAVALLIIEPFDDTSFAVWLCGNPSLV